MKINVNEEMIGFETILELIEMFSKIINKNLPDKAQEDIKEIVAWCGSVSDKKDIAFISKTLKKTCQKLEDYFHKKDLKEIFERSKQLQEIK